MGIEKGLLAFTRIRSDKMFAGIFGTHAEKLHVHPGAIQHYMGRTPVYFGFYTSFRITRDENSRRIHTKFCSEGADLTPDGRFSSSITTLNNQPVINTACRMALLFRPVLVSFKPLFYGLKVRTKNRVCLLLPLPVTPRFSTDGFPYRIPRVPCRSR